MRGDDGVRLRHMRDAAREAIGFARDCRREDLDCDRMLVLALVKAVEIIGEAAFRVSGETQRRLPDIVWEDIVGMRHRLVHAYYDINLDILWRTIQDDLPPLLEALQRSLGEQG